MTGATPGQAVEAKRRIEISQSSPHSLAGALLPPIDSDDALKKFGQDRAAMALNFVSTKPDATAVRYTPNAKVAVGDDAHAIADKKGAETGQKIAQEVRTAGGTEFEAISAGHTAREYFKHYSRGQDSEEEKVNKPGQQNQREDLLAQDQTDPLGNPLADPRKKQLVKAKATQQAEPQEDAVAEALVARGDKHGNVNLAANGFRWVGKQALSQPLATAQLTAEQAPLAPAIEQPIQKYTINNTAVREALESFRTQQPFTAARFKEPYKLGNFQRPNHANLTIVSVGQEQENAA